MIRSQIRFHLGLAALVLVEIAIILAGFPKVTP